MGEDFLDTLLRVLMPGRDRGAVRESDPAREFVERLTSPPVVPEGTQSGPGPMEWLSPEGAMGASLPIAAAARGGKRPLSIIGRMFNTGGEVSGHARGPSPDFYGDYVRLFRELAPDAKARGEILRSSYSDLGKELGQARSRMFHDLADQLEGLEQSRTRGAAFAAGSSQGRRILDAAFQGGMRPEDAIQRLDAAAIEDLFRQAGITGGVR